MSSRSPHYETDDKNIQWTGTDLIIKPRYLNIVWGNDNRYWRLPKPEHKDSDSPAELLQVNWLEVNGTATLSPGKAYEIGFKVSLTPDAFGWSGLQIYIMAKLGKRGRYILKKSSVVNNSASEDGKFEIPSSSDGLKIDIPNYSSERTVYFGLYEVWSGRWKGGLQIHSAFIREVK